ncbi:DNA polymerase IV [Roseibium sp.]|uniref:DNA polymerase IV n=1 Tax=Roseibium sp. TaxID=1936156 RepID=UPI003A978B5C
MTLVSSAPSVSETSPQALCRDCCQRVRPRRQRCPSCGSSRLLQHPELFSLTIAHVDCDAFYASVEKRDNPDLIDQPVIVGGGQRGVVSTCCYIARIYGVRSAMPMFKALEACPDAVVVKPNMEKYAEVGQNIRERMRALTPLVEPISIDEAFLDLTGTEQLHHASAAETLVRFARAIEEDLKITVSVGLAANKFLAKLASDLDKPRGFSVIGAAEAKTYLADMPVGKIWGVGKVLRDTLARDGLTTIGQLQLMDPTDLARRYGAMGIRLATLSHGRDDRKVTPERPTKSVSAETTFNSDISRLEVLRPILLDLSEKVSRRMKAADHAGRTVTLKLKTADFKTITRSRQLADPTQLADRLFRAGDNLLEREVDGQRRFRLIGIGLSDLSSPDNADPQDLVDQDADRRKNAELAMDRVREKYGKTAVERGLSHQSRKERDKLREDQPEDQASPVNKRRPE